MYADIVRHLARVERVRIVVSDAGERARARRMLAKSEADLAAVEFFVVPTNRGWTRDYGPIFIKNCAGPGGIGLINWHFNAWAKYDDWQKDDAATKHLIPKLKMPVWEPERLAGKATGKGRFAARIVLEGGSIDVNGVGTLLTTEECLLSKVQARNPGCTRADMEAIFRDYLGVTNTLWLGNGIAGDDTHGHVDDLARFVKPTTVVTVVESNRADANFAPLQETLARLRGMKEQDGRPLRVEMLPMPEPVYFGTPAPSRQLREFLHRQRVRARSDVQRRERPYRAQHARRPLPGSPGRRHPLPRSRARPGHAALHDPAAAGLTTRRLKLHGFNAIRGGQSYPIPGKSPDPDHAGIS